MSAIDIVAKPVFAHAHADWLAQLRAAQAHIHDVVEFTLVFPGATGSTQEVVRHVEAVCAATSRIRFCLRSAMIVPEGRTGQFHVFLVPDEGFGAIIRLHDRLHVGPLAACLDREMPYIPHITVASLGDFDVARRIKASLNAHDLALSGHIDALEVQERGAAEPHCIARIALAHHGLFG